MTLRYIGIIHIVREIFIALVFSHVSPAVSVKVTDARAEIRLNYVALFYVPVILNGD